jgi:tripartite-type tricarboxylate transporter receptor subunit TctC
MDPVVLIGGSAVAGKSLAELIGEARAHPGAMTYASSGYFANTHLSMQLFQDASKTLITHVPYQGAGPAIAAVLGNQVTLSTAGPASIVSFLKSDRMKVYAVMARERIASLPDVPTLRELGVDASYYVWSAVFAPANTPPEIVATLRRATAAVAGSPSFMAAMDRAGAPPAYLDGPDLDKFLGAEARVLTKVVQLIGKSPDYKP